MHSRWALQVHTGGHCMAGGLYIGRWCPSVPSVPLQCPYVPISVHQYPSVPISVHNQIHPHPDPPRSVQIHPDTSRYIQMNADPSRSAIETGSTSCSYCSVLGLSNHMHPRLEPWEECTAARAFEPSCVHASAQPRVRLSTDVSVESVDSLPHATPNGEHHSPM